MPSTVRITWPDFGRPATPPALTLADCTARLAQVRAVMTGRGLDALVVYGDREHAANLHWITGFDPRFEVALLVITPGGGWLLAGNECYPYTRVSPLVVAGVVQTLLVPSFSLLSQPRGGVRIADAIAQTIPHGARVGAAGWTYFGADEVDEPASALDLPAFIADPLRARAASVENATDLFMHPGHGLRTRVDVAELVRLEFAGDMAARAMRRMIFGLREGMTDFAAVEAAGIGGLPLGCHSTLATGDRADQGMSSASGQILRRGSPLGLNICHWGANSCRAGWLAHGPDDLPDAAQDYLAVFAGPYVQAMSDWCAMMRPGVAGGAVWDKMMTLLPHEMFGVTLNPGHLIGLDEWISSPIMAGSDIPLASGMAMQMDVIPGHPVYGSTRMEDGYVIADADLIAALGRDHPDVLARCQQRIAFMRGVIGMDVPDGLLPLADTCGIVAPWMLNPEQVITLR